MYKSGERVTVIDQSPNLQGIIQDVSTFDGTDIPCYSVKCPEWKLTSWLSPHALKKVTSEAEVVASD